MTRTHRSPRSLRQESEQVRLLLDLHGDHPVGVDFATGGGPNDRGFVRLRTDQTLTYCLDAAAVTSLVHGWMLASLHADRLPLPATSPVPVGAGLEEVVGSVTLAGDRPAQVLGFAPDRSPTGAAHVVVRFGSHTIRCHDRAAVATRLRAAVRMYRMAGQAFEVPPGRSLDELWRLARQQVQTRYRVPAPPRRRVATRRITKSAELQR